MIIDCPNVFYWHFRTRFYVEKLLSQYSIIKGGEQVYTED